MYLVQLRPSRLESMLPPGLPAYRVTTKLGYSRFQKCLYNTLGYSRFQNCLYNTLGYSLFRIAYAVN